MPGSSSHKVLLFFMSWSFLYHLFMICEFNLEIFSKSFKSHQQIYSRTTMNKIHARINHYEHLSNFYAKVFKNVAKFLFWFEEIDEAQSVTPAHEKWPSVNTSKRYFSCWQLFTLSRFVLTCSISWTIICLNLNRAFSNPASSKSRNISTSSKTLIFCSNLHLSP